MRKSQSGGGGKPPLYGWHGHYGAAAFPISKKATARDLGISF